MAGTDALATLPRLKGAQAAASDPEAHVWLSASAGTGKTQVLAARVFRLLLRGVDPSAILCLTFTKAGAAEMAQRINTRLAAWVRMAPPQLAADLDALGERATPDLQERARTLFERELQRDPDYHEFHAWLAAALRQLGDHRRADEHIKRARDTSTTRNDHALYAAKLDRLRAQAVQLPPR